MGRCNFQNPACLFRTGKAGRPTAFTLFVSRRFLAGWSGPEQNNFMIRQTISQYDTFVTLSGTKCLNVSFLDSSLCSE